MVNKIVKTKVVSGCFYIEIKEQNFSLLCSTPANVVQSLVKQDLIGSKINCDSDSLTHGPNAILLSDIGVQNYQLKNLGASPLFRMFYQQNILNQSVVNGSLNKPIVIGSAKQLDLQLEYITRSNYGLLNEFEFSNLDLSDSEISQIMDAKLYFASINVFNTTDLLNLKYLIKQEPIEIRNSIFIKRLKVNMFELSYGNEIVIIDLNLQDNDLSLLSCELPYVKLPYNNFSVIYSQKSNESSISSILMYKGDVYLIDVPYNILDIINSLGIGVNDIKGVFVSNSHDDNFIGLSSLLLRDNKLKYYSSKLIRHSVMKKFSLLLSVPLSTLDVYFEYIDLVHSKWNNINGLEVKPFLSVNSIESNIFYFRTNINNTYKTYAHLNNIITSQIMKKMIKNNTTDVGISKKFYSQNIDNQSIPVDLKQVSFSKNIEKNIETGIKIAQFKQINTLFSDENNYLKEKAKYYLSQLFCKLEANKLSMLVNSEIVSIAPETSILKANESIEFIYLILTGSISRLNENNNILSSISEGVLLFCQPVLLGENPKFTYITKTYTNALKIKIETYNLFIQNNSLNGFVENIIKKQNILQNSSIFNSFLSQKVFNIIVKSIIIKDYTSNERIIDTGDGLFIIVKGSIKKILYKNTVKQLLINDFFGVDNILTFQKSNYEYRAVNQVQLYLIPKNIIKNIPVVHWKLLLEFQKQLIW